MAKRGRPFSENPKRAKITVRMTDEEYDRLKRTSKENGMTILDYVRDVLSTNMERSK